QLNKEADELNADLTLLDSEIKARQTKVADDGFYVDAIDQIQRIIDATQKGIDGDRKRTMTVLDEMQATLTRSQPALENLTPEQKQLAADMGKSLEDVSAARREYTEAAAVANKQADEEISEAQAKASALTSRVQARKRELGDATALAADKLGAPPPAATLSPADISKAIEQKSAELAATEKTRADAQAAWNAANSKLADLRTRLTKAQQAGKDHDKLIIQRDIEVKNLEQLINQYELKKKLADAVSYPVKPDEREDIKAVDLPDQRPVYSLAAVGVIVA